MVILRNEEIPHSAWRELLCQSHHSTPFQTPEWYNLVNSVYGLSAHAVAVAENNDLLALAVLILQKEAGIKGFFSRRGIIYGGPLIDPGHPEDMDLLLQVVDQDACKKVIYTETRNLTDYSIYSDIFKKHAWNYIPYVNYQVNTSDRQFMTSSVSDSRMRQIKKAVKAGINWREASSINEVMEFYNILRDLYRAKVRKPLLSWEFFRKCYEEGFGKYLLVHYSERIIGGIFCPVMDSKALYELYVCGLDNDFRDQYPSVTATWAAMEYANKNDIPVFDFMGAGRKNEEYGVREFKSRFGGTLVEFGRYNKVYKPFLYRIGKMGLKMLRYIG